MIPSFIIIGAARSGTTSLYYYLKQHPQICMSRIKETVFFAWLASQAETAYEIRSGTSWQVTSFEDYQAQFEVNPIYKAYGEASPFYLYAPGVPKHIKQHLPDVKLILTLRNPIERAYSAYLKNCREGLESRRFEDALQQEIHNPGRVISSQNCYLRAGMYHQCLTRYLEYFDRDRIKINYYEDLQTSPQAFLRDIFHFIEVDAGFAPDMSVKFNEAIPPLIKKSASRRFMKGITRHIRAYLPQRLYYSLLNLKYAANKRITAYPPLSFDTRQRLRDQFAEDIQKLQQVLNRDLSHWLIAE